MLKTAGSYALARLSLSEGDSNLGLVEEKPDPYPTRLARSALNISGPVRHWLSHITSSLDNCTGSAGASRLHLIP